MHIPLNPRRLGAMGLCTSARAVLRCPGLVAQWPAGVRGRNALPARRLISTPPGGQRESVLDSVRNIGIIAHVDAVSQNDPYLYEAKDVF